MNAADKYDVVVLGSGTGGPVTSFGYDSMNRKTSETNALGYVTTYSYDNAGELTSVALPNPTGGTGAGPTTRMMWLSGQKNNVSSASHTASATRPPGLSTRRVSRSAASGSSSSM